ncbi:MAG: hypothetical protein QME25_09920 [Bacteroidota bacterium]|nr:hypothetical protein [Bacteroidota bacterium]
MTLDMIASQYNLTPAQLAQKIRAGKKPKVAIAEGGGYGRKNVNDVCEQLDIPVETGLERLEKNGIRANANSNVHMGPQWYWEREKYQIKHNVKAQIKGEVKEVQGRYEFYPWEIVQDGKTMSFAGPDRKPNWSGGREGKMGAKSGKGGKRKGGKK